MSDGFGDWLRARLLGALEKRYGRRDTAAVRVHELLEPLSVFRRGGRRGGEGYLVVGEAVERGLRDMLSAVEPPEAVYIVPLELLSAPESALALLEERGVDLSGGLLTVAGRTDLVVADDPDGVMLWELKTTRSARWRSYMDKWLVQTALYAALYREPVRLVVLNVASGSVDVYSEVMRPRRGLVECILERWLRGDWPSWAGCLSL